ncbi:MAG: exo-alpha-sialidase [Lentisphaerae bacterium]|nr:exo-alpha-sialidase [Lentisphaerota bacterium]
MQPHPSIRVYRELYYPAPGPGVAIWLTPAYVGQGLTRAELISASAADDAYVDWQHRQSADNGRTWSSPKLLPGVVQETPAGGIVIYPSHPIYDPRSGRSYRFNMMRQWPGQPCYTYNFATGKHRCFDHVFVTENDGPMRLLRYEEGADYQPDNPFDPTYLHTNQAYFGNAPAFGANGTIYYPICLVGHGKDGVYLFRREPASGEWVPSNRCGISPELSSRGLLEPEAAVIRDGRILIVCRGSNTVKTPGRKWRILSQDGGKTLGPVEEFRYDDGEQFYSPSSIHHFIRSSRSGKLYWFANIVPEPPQGNSPRYPLCIAEIDEERAAVRKNSLIELDTRRAGEPEALQFSNFAVLEDRQTGAIEIYITLLGLNPSDFWRSDVYRYVFTPSA